MNERDKELLSQHLRRLRPDGYYSFISYARRGPEMEAILPFIRGYVDELKRHIDYIPIFLDEFYVAERAPQLSAYLADALRRSNFTTTFISPEYHASAWCGFEYGYASAIHDTLGGRRSKETPRHELLNILWKRRDDGSVSSLYGDRWTVDISRQVAEGNHIEATRTAVDGTLSFLHGMYFDRAE